MNKNLKKIIYGILVALLVFLVIPMTIYLYALPMIVSNANFLEFVQKSVKSVCGAELIIQKPTLKTYPRLLLKFTSDNILLTKDGETLLSIDNLNCGFSIKKLLLKQIILNKFGADDLYIDINGLQKLTLQEGGEQKPSIFAIEWFNSVLYLKKCMVLYKNEDDVLIKVLAKDLEITKEKNPKYVHFSILTDIEYDNQRFRLLFKDFDRVYIKDKKINIDNFQFIVDKSMVNVNGFIDKNSKYNITVNSKKFNVKSVQSALESNLIIANGKEVLACFKDLNGNFDFDFNMTNKGMKGVVKVNRVTSKLIPLANIPLTVTKGIVEIGSQDIQMKDFEGYYGSKSSNKVAISGDVKDYINTAKTTILVTGDAENEFAKYVSKVAGCNFTLKGLSKAALKVETDTSGVVKVSGGFKIPKGSDLLIENTSISPIKFDRAVGIKLSLLKNILDIEHINYYISDLIAETGRPVSKPLVSVSSNVNIVTGQINKLAFDIPEPIPSEFFNVLINQKFFKRGTFNGNLEYVNTDKKNPYINSNIALKDVIVLGQGLRIKNASVKSTKNSNIHIVSDGNFRRTKYKINGDIQNKMLFPIIVKNIELNLDELDVEKVLSTFGPRPQLTEEQLKQLREKLKAKQPQIAKSDVPLKYFEIEEKPQTQEKTQEQTKENSTQENEEPIVFQPNLVAIKSCKFNLNKGKYKLINFGNLHANLTLTEKGILEIKSNKFDFADGISTLKIYCDMAKQKYSVRLGAKDVDSDAIATSTLNLPREISGKASALLEFNTDEKMKLNGRIQFAINNGSIMKLGLVQYILNMASIFRNPVAMVSPSTLFDLVNVPDGTFKKISGDLRIENNVIERMMIKSSSPQLSALIFGQINLETFDSSLRIYTKFSGKDRGITGFLRNISLNSLANRNILNAEEVSYYAAELKLLPKLETGEESAQVFLTKFDGDVQSNNFISSLKKIK